MRLSICCYNLPVAVQSGETPSDETRLRAMGPWQKQKSIPRGSRRLFPGITCDASANGAAFMAETMSVLLSQLQPSLFFDRQRRGVG